MVAVKSQVARKAYPQTRATGDCGWMLIVARITIRGTAQSYVSGQSNMGARQVLIDIRGASESSSQLDAERLCRCNSCRPNFCKLSLRTNGPKAREAGNTGEQRR